MIAMENVIDVRAFGYDAIETSKTRRAPKRTVKHEDKVLTQSNRNTMAATSHDVVRNFNIVSWMVRKHLDYCTRFSFLAKTGDAEFDKTLEAFVDNYSRKENCHAAGRHPLRRLIRIAEGRRLLDGDFGLLKVKGRTGGRNRGKLQGIEQDLIADPKRADHKANETWLNGCRLNEFGGTDAYGIHRRRKQGGTEYVKTVTESNMILHAYYDSTFRHDQVRGVSAIGAAIAQLQDAKEITDLHRAKHKVAQIFGLVTKRDTEERVSRTLRTDLSDEDDATEAAKPEEKFEVSFDAGPIHLDLGIDDTAEFLENKTNAGETVEMLRFLMQICILALDLPISMLDERATTFFGGRGALMQYLKSCGEKIEDVKDVLNEVTSWRLRMAIADGDLALPAGMMFEDIKYEWVPCGTPWWDPAKEVKGHVEAIRNNLTTHDQVIREVSGGRHSFEDNATKNASNKELLESLGLSWMGESELPGEVNEESELEISGGNAWLP